MQTLVIIQIYTDLLIKRKVARSFLSDKYELSTRTITRYIDILTQAGIPIISTSGVGGGYKLAEDYLLEKHALKKEELLRIKASLQKTVNEFSDDLNLEIIDKL